jgi:hypothetical protein
MHIFAERLGASVNNDRAEDRQATKIQAILSAKSKHLKKYFSQL